jgi:predicted helicase
MDEEARCYIDKTEERLLAEVQRLDDLRAADQRAVEVAQEGVQERMQGFPQQYATKQEQDAIKETAQRLEASSIDRKVYDQAMSHMREAIHAKLEKQVFESWLAEHTTWRRQVEQRLNAASGISQGISRTFTWAIAALGAVGTAVALILVFN